MSQEIVELTRALIETNQQLQEANKQIAKLQQQLAKRQGITTRTRTPDARRDLTDRRLLQWFHDNPDTYTTQEDLAKAIGMNKAIVGKRQHALYVRKHIWKTKGCDGYHVTASGKTHLLELITKHEEESAKIQTHSERERRIADGIEEPTQPTQAVQQKATTRNDDYDTLIDELLSHIKVKHGGDFIACKQLQVELGWKFWTQVKQCAARSDALFYDEATKSVRLL